MSTTYSLESWLARLLLCTCTLLLLLLCLSAWLAGASGLLLLTLTACLLPALFLLADSIKTKLLRPYFALSSGLDAILAEDYSLELTPTHKTGISARVFADLARLSLALRQDKRRFDEKDLLVHSLIQQLDSPIMLLDGDDRLIQGNQALSRWLSQDWRLVRLTQVQHLGLQRHHQGWRFSKPRRPDNFKIRSSHFRDASGEHQLLIMTDISLELRQMQSESWQQLVRVLSHEIRNSLTPIQSLAQTLAQLSDDRQQQHMLAVIVERSRNLNEFVSRYGQLSQVVVATPAAILLSHFFDAILPLYPECSFELQLEADSLYGDPVLLERVILNLLENALQACANSAIHPMITVRSVRRGGRILLEICDNGPGLQNSDNLFVPFYTTKPQGQGIGLVLSRTMIERQQGSLSLENNPHGPGAVARISLPMSATTLT
jgi:two-component system, NtrC family, nitrogen regulation sensor histidine kinase NtrY